MASAQRTIDHATIQRSAETRGGKPAPDDPGAIRGIGGGIVPALRQQL